ncbi:MAG: hypothetical protein WCI57_01925 [Candidatus Berkelbacteria bacterium]
MRSTVIILITIAITAAVFGFGTQYLMNQYSGRLTKDLEKQVNDLGKQVNELNQVTTGSTVK